MIGLYGKLLNRLGMVAVLVACCTCSLNGCAATDQRQSPQRITAPEVVYLTLKGTEWYQLQPVRPSPLMRSITPVRYRATLRPVAPQRITVAKVRYNAGPAAARYVVPVSPGELIMESLQEELSAAGYQVIRVDRMPMNVNGVDLSRIATDLERVEGLLTLDGSCTMRITLDLWQNGWKSKSHSYSVNVSDSAILNQDRLLEKVLKKSAQDLAKQALPDIINAVSAPRN